jgi:hypothetical protein
MDVSHPGGLARMDISHLGGIAVHLWLMEGTYNNLVRQNTINSLSERFSKTASKGSKTACFLWDNCGNCKKGLKSIGYIE